MGDASRKSSPSTDDDGWPLRAQYDWAETAPSMAVVETAADATDRDPTGIEPLYDSIDPGGLDRLLSSGEPEAERVGITVSFTFAGLLVTVHGTGEVVLRPARETRADGQ